MQIDREKLLGQLKAISSGLSKNELLQQSNCFVFNNGRVFTFNEEVACIGDTDLEFTGAVVADPLLKLLDRLSGEKVDVEVGEGQLVISQVDRTAKRKATILMETDLTLPIDCVESPKEWKKLPESFTKAIGVVASCAGNDQTKFFLTCVNMTSNWVESSDDYRVCRYRMGLKISEAVLIRAQAAKKVCDCGMTRISVTNDWVHFKNEQEQVMACRRYFGKYPDIGRFLKMDGQSVKFPKGLKAVVDKCSIFIDSDSVADEVIVELKSNAIRLTGRGPAGKYEESQKAEYSGPPVKFRMNPKLLCDVADRAEGCEIATGRIRVKTRDWVYVTCTAEVGE